MRTIGDWVIAALVAVSTVIEVVIRDEPRWRVLAAFVGAALVCALLLARRRPLLAVAIGFGAVMIADGLSLALFGRPFMLVGAVSVLLLIYLLVRWASRTHAIIGVAIAFATWAVSIATDFPGGTNAVGGAVVIALIAAIGTALRFRAVARAQQFTAVRSRERELLARELHDTVAHHVSAIAIQAQAGQTSPGEAAASLAVIEREAATTLAEMRDIVGSLRGTVSNRGLPDLETMTAESTDGLLVSVELSGDLHHLRPSLESTVYRIAQEAVTNARRHARHATRVEVLVVGDTETIRIAVTDDGVRGTSIAVPGFGMVGMTERATLLGGTLEAGVVPEGWRITAVLPRSGSAA